MIKHYCQGCKDGDYPPTAATVQLRYRYDGSKGGGPETLTEWLCQEHAEMIFDDYGAQVVAKANADG